MNTVRGSSILGGVVVSVVVGVALGLGVAWGIAPVQYVNADPMDLRSVYKDDYLRMIGATYELDGDLSAARQRLAQLGLANPAQTLNRLIAQEQQRGVRAEVVSTLAHLAQDLGFPVPESATRRTPAPEEAPAINTNPAQISPPTVFLVSEKTALTCNDQANGAQLKFTVRDALGRDLANAAIEIHWEAGDEVIYTGLKPEQGLGYADFDVEPGSYSAKIQNAAGDSATELNIGATPANCKNDRGATPRGWKIVFKQKQF